jgi:putative cardiolipin synthase
MVPAWCQGWLGIDRPLTQRLATRGRQRLTRSSGSATFVAPLLCLLLLALAGCVSVPLDYPKTASSARTPGAGTELGKLREDWLRTHGGDSGFIGLPNGIEALGARLKMMEAAESTIDAQYFILKKDRAGALFTGNMLLAADRGVRVRLLIDDIFTPDADEVLTLLDSHPNIDVRLFNPVSRQGFKYWSFLFDFKRANRRMHNKSFTVDNTLSIVGGRNIGEEYFDLKTEVKFDDYEVLAIGPVVQQVSAGFDAFWNSELSVPIEAFGLRVNSEDLDRFRAYIREQTELGSSGVYAQAVNSRVLTDIREKRITPVAAPATLVTDSPEKLGSEIGDATLATLAGEIGRRFRAAQEEIIIVTPYFVPQERGARLLEELLARGVRIVIVTNSLASTNHVPVHSGYARYRKRLLRAGAEIYEIRADSVGEGTEWGHRPEFVTLHSKATIVDRSTIFIGSLNFDPRSIFVNSEMGLFVESPDVGGRFTQNLVEDLPAVTFRVQLKEDDSLQWVYEHDGKREVFEREPLAGWGRRAIVPFYRLLPIEDQL